MRLRVLAAVLLSASCLPSAAYAEPTQSGAASIAAAVEKGTPSVQPQSSSGMTPDAATLSDAKAADTNPIELSTPPAADGAGQSATVALPPAPPPPSLLVDIDLSKQRMTVTERGKVKHSWPISSGRQGYRTPTGTFRPTWMAKMWFSKQYDDAPMPHSVFFNGGIAVHGTQATGMLGRPASHGCIRLAPSNAAALYAMVSAHGKPMTRIKVHGTAKDTTPVAARRQPRPGAENSYAVRAVPKYAPSSRYYASPRYSYNTYGGGYGSGNGPRFVYPGDAPPYGYRPARPLYRPYGGSRYYYD